MATLRERLRARREAERRGLRRFTIGMSEGDLRLLAKHGYGGAAALADAKTARSCVAERPPTCVPDPCMAPFATAATMAAPVQSFTP